MTVKQIITAAALSVALVGLASCADDSATERDAPASEQGEESKAEYED